MIRLTRTDSSNKDFHTLVAELDKYLAIKNGEENTFFAQFNKVDHIRHVVLAYDGDTAVGCGAIKEYAAGIMEVKRMFVPVERRGAGIASMVLQELEAWAVEMNYTKCVLETLRENPDAISLYKKNRYYVIPNYGQYIGIESSVCFEKILNP